MFPDEEIKRAGTRQFDTGATRDTDVSKIDFEGHLSPIVLSRYGRYMHQARKRNVPEGMLLRESDNWQKGMPRDVYMKSLIRHMMELWAIHRKEKEMPVDTEYRRDAACAIMFNVMGYLYEDLNGR